MGFNHRDSRKRLEPLKTPASNQSDSIRPIRPSHTCRTINWRRTLNTEKQSSRSRVKAKPSVGWSVGIANGWPPMNTSKVIRCSTLLRIKPKLLKLLPLTMLIFLSLSHHWRYTGRPNLRRGRLAAMKLLSTIVSSSSFPNLSKTERVIELKRAN